METQLSLIFYIILLKHIHCSSLWYILLLAIKGKFCIITKENGANSLFSLFCAFDLKFDLDLATEVIFKCIVKKFKHILQ